ncbi:MAG: hypothetical protein IPP78_12760 [Holophagaceae bacterium]|nr:hypothetical protein [Holophagaceae bacterium]
MTILPVLIELQATHDYLRTIERDLTALPPDLAALDAQIKAQDKRLNELDRGVLEGTAQVEKLTKELELAKRLEEHARKHLKTVDQKVKYAAAIREVDERERQRHGLERPLKELEARLVAAAKEQAEIKTRRIEAHAQFTELHQIFMAEHENQVVARKELEKKRKTLESKMTPAEVTRFGRLLSQRMGRAVVKVEGGICTGCRVKLRSPFLVQLHETKSPMGCESCQRIIYIA